MVHAAVFAYVLSFHTCMHMHVFLKFLLFFFLSSSPPGVVLQMAILDENVVTMNRSLGELHDMRHQMASVGSTLSSYNARLDDLSSTIGDTILANTNIQDTLQGFADKLLSFGVSDTQRKPHSPNL